MPYFCKKKISSAGIKKIYNNNIQKKVSVISLYPPLQDRINYKIFCKINTNYEILGTCQNGKNLAARYMQFTEFYCKKALSIRK